MSAEKFELNTLSAEEVDGRWYSEPDVKETNFSKSHTDWGNYKLHSSISLPTGKPEFVWTVFLVSSLISSNLVILIDQSDLEPEHVAGIWQLAVEINKNQLGVSCAVGEAYILCRPLFYWTGKTALRMHFEGQDKCNSSLMNGVKQYFLIACLMVIEFRTHLYWWTWVCGFPLRNA